MSRDCAPRIASFARVPPAPSHRARGACICEAHAARADARAAFRASIPHGIACDAASVRAVMHA
ncbi:hypothetical protein BUC_2262 [Burkholderia pseudomallei 576]|nr:hypothetical protein BUC_2262 [Burkholderia pseudomallei 576]